MPIFAYIIFGLIILTIVVMIIINFMYKNIKKLREDAEDRYYRNQKIKEQKEKNPFGEDYFKSSNKKQQNNYRQQGQYSAKEANAKTSYANNTQGQTSRQQETTARKTKTDSGVTIIDDRSEDKKIFTHDDGEYVEFEEVHD